MSYLQYKSLLKFLLISIIGITFSEECYVLKGTVYESADGTEVNPFPEISNCINHLGNPDPDDTIYIGPGYYFAQSINVGPMTIVGSGVNVTKIYNNNSTCFYNFKGTIKDLAFSSYNEFDGGQIYTRIPNTAIETSNTNDQEFVAKIHNILFENVNGTNINVSRPYVEIRNNVFGPNSGSYINFQNQEFIVFMNNLVIRDINFQNMAGYTNNDYFNNLFLNSCSINTSNRSTYNIVFNGTTSINGETYGAGDSTCGQLGEYQPTMFFTNIYDLNFVVETWNLYHIYASGENTILFDTGNPDAEFNDADGSRSDIGIMGGLYPWPSSSGPIITNFSVDPINIQIDGEVNVNSRAQTE